MVHVSQRFQELRSGLVIAQVGKDRGESHRRDETHDQIN
jgi:hypothetical protein